MASSLTRASLRHAGASWATLAVATAFLLVGASRLRSEVGYRAFLGTSHPAITRFDRFLRRFGGGLPIVAVWSCRESPACTSALDDSSLAMAFSVARALERVEGVRRVDSPATSPLVVPALLGLPHARRLAPRGEPARDRAALARLARRDPLWVGQIISEDAASGAILVHLAGVSSEASRRVIGALRDALAPFERVGFRFYLAGGPVEFVVAGEELERETQRIVPLMVLLVGAVLMALFRSPAAAAAALATVGVAVLWTFGLMGWLGWERNSLTEALAPLVLAIGACDAVHMIARSVAALDARRLSAEGGRAGDALTPAIERAAVEVGGPCLMTSLTTAIGFASLAASPIESLSRFGLLAAAGVGFAFLLTFTLLPLLASRMPLSWLQRAAERRGWERWLAALGRGTRRHRGAVLAVAAVLAAAGLAGASRLRVDASFEDLYGADSQVVRWAQGVGRLLRPPDTLEIALLPPAPGLPLGYAVIDRLARALEGRDGLGRARSIVDPMRRLNEMLHRDGPLVLGAVEDEKGRPGSLLRLLRRQDRDAVDLFVERSSGALRLTVEAEKLPQDRLRALLASVRRQVSAALPRGWRADVTGPLAVVGEMIDDIRATQLWSFALAGPLVFLTLALFFRSLADASLAMLPTLLPVVVTLGAMGIAGVPLDVGSAMVAAVVLGVAVDDAIHLIAAYRRERAIGLRPGEATAAALARTGRALVTTSVALVAGFSALALSPWKSIASFGVISALALGSALAAALLLLPAALASRRSGASAGEASPA